MTGTTFPRGTLALGTGSLLGRKSVRASTALVESALDNGIRHFDTARVYGRGESEALLGNILGERSDVSITTKVGRGSATRSRSRALHGLAHPVLVTIKDAIGRIPHTPVRRSPAPAGNFDVDFLLASIETSRRALRRQTLDCVLLHEVTAADLTEHVRDTMAELVDREWIRSFGVASDTPLLAAIVDQDRLTGSVVQQPGGPLHTPVPISVAHIPIFHSMFGRAGATLESFDAWLEGRKAETELVRQAARGLAGRPGVARALLGYAHTVSPAATFVISSALRGPYRRQLCGLLCWTSPGGRRAVRHHGRPLPLRNPRGKAVIVDFNAAGLTGIDLPNVVIIGSGPVGLSLARGLRRRGTRVLLLESGAEASTRASPFNDGDVLGRPFDGFLKRGRGLGGGSSQWAGQCIRFHASDFERRAWISESGWPFSIDELMPYYAEAEQYLGVSADGYHGRIWRDFGIEPGALIESDVAMRFSVFCPEPDLFARERKALSVDPGIVVVYNATVTEFLRTADRVSALTITSLEGNTETVSADIVIVCVGAIETARMLLQPSADFPQGLGTHSGHVGRHFQDHPTGTIAEILPNTDGLARPERIPDLFSLFYRSRLRYLPRMVMSPGRQEIFGTLNAAALPVFEWSDDSMTEDLRQLQSAVAGRRFDLSAGARLARVWKNPRTLGKTLVRRSHGRSFAEMPAKIGLHVHLEQDPATGSQVGLSTRKDPFGRPLAQVDWRIGDLERHTALRLAHEIGGFLARNDLGRIQLDPALEGGGVTEWRDVFHDNQHHAGTARMSATEADGVVDGHGKVYGISNTYVAGGAVFPTGSYTNPTLTMVAMAFRLAAHLTGAWHHALR